MWCRYTEERAMAETIELCGLLPRGWLSRAFAVTRDVTLVGLERIR